MIYVQKTGFSHNLDSLQQTFPSRVSGHYFLDLVSHYLILNPFLEDSHYASLFQTTMLPIKYMLVIIYASY